MFFSLAPAVRIGIFAAGDRRAKTASETDIHLPTETDQSLGEIARKGALRGTLSPPLPHSRCDVDTQSLARDTVWSSSREKPT